MKGGLSVCGAPKTHIVSGLCRAEHLHLGRQHVHGSTHECMVLSSVRSLMLLVFIRVKQRVVGWASSVFDVDFWCRFVLSLFMCLIMQHSSRWRHEWDEHNLHVGDMYCLRCVVSGSSLVSFISKFEFMLCPHQYYGGCIP